MTDPDVFQRLLAAMLAAASFGDDVVLCAFHVPRQFTAEDQHELRLHLQGLFEIKAVVMGTLIGNRVL